MPLASKILDIIRVGNGDDQSIDVQHHYASLLDNYNKVNQKYDQLLATHEQDLRELSTLRESSSALQDKITVLQGQLQACKDDLFRILPSSQVPDSAIAQRFENLDVQICDWIGMEISEYLDVWQAKHPGAQPKLFHHNGHIDTQNFLAEYPEMGGEYFLRHVIHRHLQKKLFDDGIYLFGLTTRFVNLFKTIEGGMSRSEPPREAATIRTWRSEALTSLARTPDFRVELEHTESQLTRELFDRLTGFFPILSGHRASRDNLYQKIIRPAVELAVTMQTSTSSYRVEPRMFSNRMFTPREISRTYLGHLHMTDVATGKTLKPESPVTPDCSDDIGTQIIVLAPGLVRLDADKFVPLTEETILVKLYKPLGRRRATTIEPK